MDPHDERQSFANSSLVEVAQASLYQWERRSMEEAAFWNGQMGSQDKKEVKKEKKNRPTLRSCGTIR